MKKNTIMLIIGTRPELIKVAPIVHYFRRVRFLNYVIVNTGQHRELLDKYWLLFDITPDYNLDVIVDNQDLSNLSARAIQKINDLIKTSSIAPKIILAQGDTTTVMASALVSFYNDIKFYHLEAGLRSGSLKNPYPEEFNRKVASIIASKHFAPTEIAKENLIKEGISENVIEVVGNTVIDALMDIRNNEIFKNFEFKNCFLKNILAEKKRIVLITVHRRENQNENLITLLDTLNILAKENPSVYFIWPLHLNPKIKDVVLKSELRELKNVIITTPFDYLELLKILSVSWKILTDSGGIQEEAPSFRVPVLILRETTERPEAVIQGFSKLVGCNKENIINSFYNFNPTFPTNLISPYGDGHASNRIGETLLKDCVGFI